jgi:hypothetical protein
VSAVLSGFDFFYALARRRSLQLLADPGRHKQKRFSVMSLAFMFPA